VAAVAAAPAPSAGTTRTLDRDGLTEAWGDGILQSLPARAKARYASGRFVSVDEQGAHFALPNAAHREQCAEQQAVVERALSEHFGTTVTLVLDIDDTVAPPVARAGPSPSASGRSPGAAPPPVVAPADDIEDIDPSELLEDTSADQASAAEARLLQAFPGASEVAE
jgi:DNA polymerase III subunit gamma/tau